MRKPSTYNGFSSARAGAPSAIFIPCPTPQPFWPRPEAPVCRTRTGDGPRPWPAWWTGRHRWCGSPMRVGGDLEQNRRACGADLGQRCLVTIAPNRGRDRPGCGLLARRSGGLSQPAAGNRGHHWLITKPVTRAKIEAIRGVDSAHVLRRSGPRAD